jgi:hypothetical protein
VKEPKTKEEKERERVQKQLKKAAKDTPTIESMFKKIEENKATDEDSSGGKHGCMYGYT